MAECLLDKACVEISKKECHFAERRFKQMGKNKAVIQSSNITALRASRTEGYNHLSAFHFKWDSYNESAQPWENMMRVQAWLASLLGKGPKQNIYIYIYNVGNFSQIWGNLDPWTTLNTFIYKKYLISLIVVVLVRACWRYSLHSGIMHFSTCSSSARHWEPSDAGIFIILALFFIPTPQLTLHGSQSAHSVTIQLLGASTCNTHTHMLLATKYGT